MNTALADAIFENHRSALDRVTALGPNAKSDRVGEILLIDAGVDNPTFNLALLPPGATDPATLPFDAIEAWFAARNAGFRFILREPNDDALAAALRDRGYRRQHSEPAMVLQTIPPPEPLPEGLDIRVVEGTADVEAYARTEDGEDSARELARAIASRAFGLTDSTLFLGRVQGRPVAHSMLFRTGDIAGVYNVFVRPEFRRRGFGAAITRAALEAGAAAGARSGTLASTEMAYSLYSAMGFETAFVLASYYAPDR